jgi:hypothetical protein
MNKEFRKQMNGFKPSTEKKPADHRIYSAPSNVVVPTTVGRFSLIRMIVIE